jgi:hypothetical protein
MAHGISQAGMSTVHHLAQINVARARAPLDSPVMKEFMDAIDAMNALGEQSPGFVWRLKSDSGNATDIRAYDDPRMIVNVTVWTSLERLRDYAFKSHHGDYFRRRREWFEEMETPSLALWWIPAGTVPDEVEGKRRLELLEKNGPTADAFTFRDRFPPPSA